jgi:hypothetical protein
MDISKPGKCGSKSFLGKTKPCWLLTPDFSATEQRGSKHLLFKRVVIHCYFSLINGRQNMNNEDAIFLSLKWSYPVLIVPYLMNPMSGLYYIYAWVSLMYFNEHLMIFTLALITWLLRPSIDHYICLDFWDCSFYHYPKLRTSGTAKYSLHTIWKSPYTCIVLYMIRTTSAG